MGPLPSAIDWVAKVGPLPSVIDWIARVGPLLFINDRLDSKGWTTSIDQ